MARGQKGESQKIERSIGRKFKRYNIQNGERSKVRITYGETSTR